MSSARKVEFDKEFEPAPHHDQSDNTDNRLALATANEVAVIEVAAIEEEFYRRAYDSLQGIQRSQYVVFQMVRTRDQLVGQKHRSPVAPPPAALRSAETLEFLSKTSSS